MEQWQQFLSHLAKQFGAPAVEKWLRPIKVLRFDAANLYLEAPDPMSAAWFEEHVRPHLKGKFFNQNNRLIRVHLTSSNREAKSVGVMPTSTIRIAPDALDPSMQEETLLQSADNEIVSKLLLEHSEVLFNPIYLYGPKNAGKTHYLMSMAAKCAKLKKHVFYVSADRFTEHVVAAIRSGQMSQFRAVYRNIDLLIVDDIEQLGGRSASQEEFFHTFNALHTAGIQIVLASKFIPLKLQNIEDRLISRFEWGISIPCHPVALREVIANKAKHWHFPLKADLLQYLLEHFSADPITALQALILRKGASQEMTPAIAEKLLADLEKKQRFTPEELVKNVSRHFGITTEDITGKSQSRECALPRQIAMYLFRQKLHLSYAAIGKYFSRDHSTVMSSIQLVEKGIEEKNQRILDMLAQSDCES